MSLKQVWGFFQPSARVPPVKLFEGNMAAIHLANNIQGAKKARHVDISHHRHVQDLVEEGKIEVLHVASCDQHADVWTKTLGRAWFEGHKNFPLNGHDIVRAAGKSRSRGLM